MRASLGVALALLLVGCAASLRNVAQTTHGQRVAVVQFTILDQTLQGMFDPRVDNLMYSRAGAMLGIAEQQLATHWQVIPAPSFVAHPAYQQMGTPNNAFVVPIVNGTQMPIIAPDNRAIARAAITPDQARAIAQITGADLVAVVQCQWLARSSMGFGGFRGVTRAFVRARMSIYDASGTLLFSGHRDARGDRVRGVGGWVMVDENSVDDWVRAFGNAFVALIQG